MVEPIGVADWADKNSTMIVDKRAVPYRTDDVPYIRGILDAATEEGVTKIVIIKAAQVGATEAVLRILGHAIDIDPRSTLIVYPNIDVSRKQRRRRLLPMVRTTPVLARWLLTGMKEAGSTTEMEFITMSVTFAGAPLNKDPSANLESNNYGLIIEDEVDRCHHRTPAILEERGKARERFLLILLGTPSHKGVGIDRQYYGSADFVGSDRRQYHVPCPHCAAYATREWKNVRWPGKLKDGTESDRTRDPNADPKMVLAEAFIVCPHCRKRIGPEHNLWQLRRGCWVKDGEAAGEATKIKSAVAGFFVPGLLKCTPPGANPYGHVAEGYCAAKGHPGQDWHNLVQGWGYSPKGDRVENETIRSQIRSRAMGGHRMGEVPREALLLTAGVDVQAGSCWVEIVAWGELMRECWLVWAQQVRWIQNDPPTELDSLIDRGFPCPDGRVLRCVYDVIDSGQGGGRQQEVYARAAARAQRRLLSIPSKARGLGGGAEHMPAPTQFSYCYRLPDGKPDANGPRLLLIDSMYYKDAAMRRLKRIGEDDGEGSGDALPGGEQAGGERAGGEQAGAAAPLIPLRTFHLPEDVPAWYLDQLTSEQCVLVTRSGRPRRVYELRAGRTANHLWDAHVYNLAAAEAKGLERLRKAPPKTPPAAMAPPPRETRKSPLLELAERRRG